MNTTATVRPVSLVNRVFLGLWALVLAASLWKQQFTVAIILGVAFAVMVVTIQSARRGQGSASMRVNALQPYDERDEALMAKSFSLLGQAIFVVQTAVAFVAVLFDGDFFGEVIRLLAISVLAFICTAIAVGRE